MHITVQWGSREMWKCTGWWQTHGHGKPDGYVFDINLSQEAVESYEQ